MGSKKFLPVLLLLLLMIPPVWFLLMPGFFISDDGEWMIIRFSAFYQALADGQFPVRFLGRLNFGYGYPVANFLYPGFMYFAVPIHILGLSFISTIKAVLIFSMIGTSVFSYFWLSKFFDKFSAVIGSLFLTYTPYHLFDLYKRGSVGELFAFVWVSFVLWMIDEKNTFFVAIGVFLLAVSHNTIFLLLAPLLFIYSILRKALSIKDTVVSFVLGILMSSFFTLPAVHELAFTRFSQTKISDVSAYFVDFQLIGLSTITVLVLSLFIYLKQKKNDRIFIFFFLISILSIFFSIKLSEPIWNLLPSSLVQFPFRLLSYLVLSVGFLTAYAISKFSNIRRYLISAVLILLLFLSAIPFLKPSELFDKGDSFYSTNEATTTVQDEYMPKWVKDKPITRYEKKVEILEGRGEIRNLSYNDSKKVMFDVNAESKAQVRVNTIYYPGWGARVNGAESKIDYSNDRGVMELDLKKGSSRVEFLFGETPLRLFADIVSLSSLIALIVISQTKLIRRVRS